MINMHKDDLVYCMVIDQNDNNLLAKCPRNNSEGPFFTVEEPYYTTGNEIVNVTFKRWATTFDI